MVKRGVAKGLVARAKFEADRFRKSYKQKDEKITLLKTEGTSKEEAFKIGR